MTDVSFAVMGLLIAVGLLLTTLKVVPPTTARAIIYTGIGILCGHTIGITIVAPISEAAADTLSLIALFSMAAMIVFLASRGLARIVQKDKSAASEGAS